MGVQALISPPPPEASKLNSEFERKFELKIPSTLYLCCAADEQLTCE